MYKDDIAQEVAHADYLCGDSFFLEGEDELGIGCVSELHVLYILALLQQH